jgi:hypothetical protein
MHFSWRDLGYRSFDLWLLKHNLLGLLAHVASLDLPLSFLVLDGHIFEFAYLASPLALLFLDTATYASSMARDYLSLLGFFFGLLIDLILGFDYTGCGPSPLTSIGELGQSFAFTWEGLVFVHC